MSKSKEIIDKIDESSLSRGIRPIKITSFMEGMKWNGAFSGDYQNREYYSISGYLFESITHEFEKEFKGGMIVFSTEVNAVYNKSGFFTKIKGFFKSKVKTLINALKKNKKLSDLLSNFEEVVAYSVGNFFRGKYFDRETGKTYDEKSLSVEIIGIPSQILTKIAESIAKEFEQKEVLVKAYDSGRIFMVDKN